MPSLVYTIIAIAVFSLALFAGAGYLNYDAIRAAGDTGKINAGITAVSSSIAQYRMLEEDMPSDFQELIDSGYMRFKPQLTGNIDWPSSNELNFDNTTGALNLCFGGNNISKLDYEVMTRIELNLGDEAVKIGTACFISNDEVITSEFPTSVWLTYRIQ